MRWQLLGGEISAVGDTTTLVKLGLRGDGELDLDGSVLGVKDDAGLTILGVAGRVITFWNSSFDTPRISDILATIAGSQ